MHSLIDCLNTVKVMARRYMICGRGGQIADGIGCVDENESRCYDIVGHAFAVHDRSLQESL